MHLNELLGMAFRLFPSFCSPMGHCSCRFFRSLPPKCPMRRPQSIGDGEQETLASSNSRWESLIKRTLSFAGLPVCSWDWLGAETGAPPDRHPLPVGCFVAYSAALDFGQTGARGSASSFGNSFCLVCSPRLVSTSSNGSCMQVVAAAQLWQLAES